MKKIKIPKIKTEYGKVFILKTKSTRRDLVLQKQTIEGVEIKKDSTIGLYEEDWLFPSDYNSTGTSVCIPAKYINDLLRFTYLENIRNGGNK